jgi:hypothetical protein
MEWKEKLVIHDEWGGFGLTERMVEMLKARGCEWADKCGKSGGSNPRWYLPYEHDNRDHLRKDPDLVAIVEELTVEYDKRLKDEGIRSWKERSALRRELLNDLKVVEVSISIEIDDHDGRESVRVCGGVW